MDTSLNPRLQSTAELFRHAGLFCLPPLHHQYTFFQNPPPSLSHAYWPYPRSLVEANVVPQHQCPVDCPVGATVGHPVSEFLDNLPESQTRHPKL